jgi:hypothetical protein
MEIKLSSLMVCMVLAVVVGYAVEGDVLENAPVLIQQGSSWRDTVEVIIGTPAMGNVIPFWGASHDACRFQVLFYQSEINTSGTIIKLALLPSSQGFVTGTYYNVHVYFCYTHSTELVSTFDLNYTGNTPVEVLTEDTMTVGGAQNAWMDWEVNFAYNNTDNLLVEITWEGDDGTNVAFWRTSEAVPRRLYAWDNQATSGTLQNTGNHARLTIDTGTGIEEGDMQGSIGRIFLRAAPNPFVSATDISYQLSSTALVRLDVYDIAGKKVKRLVESRQVAGLYSMQWDGIDAFGRAVGNGVYFVRLELGEETIVLPIVLLK